jgi:hypothetical protein
MKLAICTIQRNRGLWLKEWFAFHYAVGFRKFYFFAHKCTDNTSHVILDLKKHFDIEAFVLGDDLERPQLSAYQHAYQNFNHDFDWIAFIDGDEFFIDLVFYNRLLQCFVVIEIKNQKLTHQDIGQLQMYVNYYDRLERQDFENPTIGILLCTDKNDAMVKITLPENNNTIIASKYQLYLPTEQQLIDEVKKEIEKLDFSQTKK